MEATAVLPEGRISPQDLVSLLGPRMLFTPLNRLVI